MSGGIKLNWKDRNFSETSHNIYRSDTTMSLSNMPTPIATVGSNITEYIDYDVIQGNMYYYRIGAIRGNDEAISDELVLIAEELDLGPGSQELIGGDMTTGFFGEVPVSELVTGDDLATSIGLTAGVSQYSNEPWLKFALDGNIIFVAKKPYRYSISWESIYQAGAVYGTGDNGYNPSGGDRLQDALISVNEYNLIVTLLRGANTDPIASYLSGWDETYTHNSEWNRLMYPIHSTVHTDSRNPDTPSVQYAQWATYTDGEVFVGSVPSNGRSTIMQETPNTSNNHRLYRGGNGVTYSTANSTTLNGSNGWRPALRLNL